MMSGAVISELEPAKRDQRKKIAFCKIGSFSHINDFVGKQLTRYFPNLEVEVIWCNRAGRGAELKPFRKMIFAACQDSQKVSDVVNAAIIRTWSDTARRRA
jgi:hypothetical protein